MYRASFYSLNTIYLGSKVRLKRMSILLFASDGRQGQGRQVGLAAQGRSLHLLQPSASPGRHYVLTGLTTFPQHLGPVKCALQDDWQVSPAEGP